MVRIAIVPRALTYAMRATGWLHTQLYRWQQALGRRGVAQLRARGSARLKLRLASGDSAQARRRQLLAQRLAVVGCRTLTEFAALHPAVSTATLARRLKLEAAEHDLVYRALLAEAEAEGRVEAFVRDQVFRWVHAPRTEKFRHGGLLPDFEAAILALIGALPDYRSNCYRVAAAYANGPLPALWRPTDAGDPDLLELFSVWFDERRYDAD